MRMHPGQYKGMSILLTNAIEPENVERVYVTPIY